MYENLQFAHSFGKFQDSLLKELLDNIDPLEDLTNSPQNYNCDVPIESPSSESMSSVTNFALTSLSEAREGDM